MNAVAFYLRWVRLKHKKGELATVESVDEAADNLIREARRRLEFGPDRFCNHHVFVVFVAVTAPHYQCI